MQKFISRKTVDCSRPNRWKYSVLVENIEIKVCKQFLTKLYDVGLKRVRCIQNKIIDGNVAMTDDRGKHLIRPHRLDDDIVPYFYQHLESIPNKISHYSSTQRRYFEHPDLSITKLFKLFVDYYYENTTKTLKMKFTSYFKMFRIRSPISLSEPQTDICNVCEAFHTLSNPTEKQQTDYDLHTVLHEKHSALKHHWLEAAREDDSILVIHFDYGQNYPMPKLNVNEQFYKRLFWVHVFNIHCYNNGRSKMYLFPEGSAKKDSSSVASFLFDFLEPILNGPKNYTKLIMFSDNCGGQNKNKYIVRFCIYMSLLHPGLEIIHIFPVPGHSFCINDSNFGLIKKKLRKMPRIVDVRVVLNKVMEARNDPSPFEMQYDAGACENWADALEPFFFDVPTGKRYRLKFAIQSYSQLKFNNGHLYATSEYGYEPHRQWIEFNYLKTRFEADNVQRSKAVSPGIAQNKIDDVKQLYKYLTEEEVDRLEEQFHIQHVDVVQVQQPVPILRDVRVVLHDIANIINVPTVL